MRRMVEGLCRTSRAARGPLRLALLATSPARGGGTMWGCGYLSAIGGWPSSRRTSLMICSTRSRYGRNWTPNS
jgi:hypothetical protein